MGYGLCEEGRLQVRDAVHQHRLLLANCRVVSSDFLRARETAELVCQLLGLKHPLKQDVRLRERYFGIHEGCSDRIYPSVWDLDCENPEHEEGGVESAAAVQRRITGVIQSLEQDWGDQDFLLVAHGDPLQMLQTAFAGISACHHRSQPHLETAGVRELVRG